jgi:hypothetical protein
MNNALPFLSLTLSVLLVGLAAGCGGGSGDLATGPAATTGGAAQTTAGASLPAASVLSWSPAGSPGAPLALGQSYTFTAQGRDPNPGASIIGYEWGFGDGTPTQVSSQNAANGTVIPTTSHAFTSAGPFTIQVRAFDSLGLTGAFTGLPVTVADVLPVTQMPTVTRPADTILVPGQSYLLTAQAAIPPGAWSGESVAGYFWDWGDGSPVEPGGSQASHAWIQAGTYAVRAWAQDNQGGVGAPSDALPVIVASPCNDLTPQLPAGPARGPLATTVGGTAVPVTLQFTVAGGVPGTLDSSTIFVSPGDDLSATVTGITPPSAGQPNWTVQVAYPPDTAPGTRTVKPSVQAHNLENTWSCAVAFPELAIQTNPVAPVITLTASYQDQNPGTPGAPPATVASTPASGSQATLQVYGQADLGNGPIATVTFDAITNQDSKYPVVYTWEFPQQPPLVAGVPAGNPQSAPAHSTQTVPYEVSPGGQMAMQVVTVTADNQQGGISQASFLVFLDAVR